MKTPDILVALKPVINIFEKLSIPYYIGGSIASSIYGMARATMDVDIVADIDTRHIPALKQHLENDYYIDEDMIKEAILNKSSFNLIHLETVLKIDVFIYKDDPYQRNAIQRKLKDTLEEDNSDTTFYFSSPEDIIINKLIWYKMGGEVSDRQWLDVIGVIKVQGESLDKSYLKDWSQKLQILELLNKAFNESGIKL
jgi:hypothetical protein